MPDWLPDSGFTLAAYVMVGWALLAVVSWVWGRRPKRPQCPACDYDMRGTSGLTCPECGHTAKAPADLTRRRRKRWRLRAAVVLMVLAGVVGYGGLVVDRHNTVREPWSLAWVPNTWYILELPHADRFGVQLIDDRMHSRSLHAWPLMPTASEPFDELWGWQRWLMARRCVTAYQADATVPQIRFAAFGWLAELEPGTGVGTHVIPDGLDSPNATVRKVALAHMAERGERYGYAAERLVTYFADAPHEAGWLDGRTAAQVALLNMSDAAIPPVLAGLEDADTRRSCLEVLLMLGPAAEPHLEQIVAAMPTGEVRDQAEWIEAANDTSTVVLAGLWPASKPALVEALSAESPARRAAAFTTMFRLAYSPQWQEQMYTLVSGRVNYFAPQTTHSFPIRSHELDLPWMREVLPIVEHAAAVETNAMLAKQFRLAVRSVHESYPELDEGAEDAPQPGP